jgi:hypothetical protein
VSLREEIVVFDVIDMIDGPGAVSNGRVEVVPDADLSSFDATVDPPYVTVRWGWRRRLLLLSDVNPGGIISSAPAVASANVIESGRHRHVVEITGHGPGTAILTPMHTTNWWGKQGTLEVDVCRQRPVYVNFHFVDKDKHGNRTSLTEAAVAAVLLPRVNDIYRAANIHFRIHHARRVPPALTQNLDFATFHQDRRKQEQLGATLHHRNREFDSSQSHLNVWCVKAYAAADEPGLKAAGVLGRPVVPVPVVLNLDVPGRNIVGETHYAGNGFPSYIILEDEPNDGLPLTLAHEFGHALGQEEHNPHEGALMFRSRTHIGKKLYRSDYRMITSRKR